MALAKLANALGEFWVSTRMMSEVPIAGAAMMSVFDPYLASYRAESPLRPSRHQQAAVDVNDLTGDIRAVGRDKEVDDANDVVRHAYAFHWNQRCDDRNAGFREHRCLDGPRSDDVARMPSPACSRAIDLKRASIPALAAAA